MICALVVKDLRITHYHSLCNATLFTLSTSGKITCTQIGIIRKNADTAQSIESKCSKLAVLLSLLKYLKRLGVLFRCSLIT